MEPEKMTVAQLREALEPYGTRYRNSMSKRQLIEALRRVRSNERRFGSAERPFGVFEDELREGGK